MNQRDWLWNCIYSKLFHIGQELDVCMSPHLDNTLEQIARATLVKEGGETNMRISKTDIIIYFLLGTRSRMNETLDLRASRAEVSKCEYYFDHYVLGCFTGS